jgi:serine/threonine-protein kinase
MSTPVSIRSIGRYLLFGELASGGMATVHFGRLHGPAGFSRTVAIKRLHPQYAKDPDFVTMFLDEARVAARIQHPNVVPTLDVITTEDEIFLVMEYVQGESLARLLRAVRSIMTPADTHVIATVMAGVLHGLHAAHEARDEQGEPLDIVHRDVSPQNVLVGIDGVARLIDFGVAKAAGRMQSTREGHIKGKLAYMAPEQLHGAPVTRQMDIYAAAVVTWEALTGKRLFQGENEAAIVTAILHKAVPAPSEAASHVPPAFDRVVMRGLDSDLSRRYQTAHEMAVDLERCVSLAPPSEVGEWVQTLAYDELLARASRVAELESASSPSSTRQPGSVLSLEMPTTVSRSSAELDRATTEPELRSEVSSIAVSPILPVQPRRPLPRGALVGGAAGAGVLLVLFALLLVRREPPAVYQGSPAAASLLPPSPPPSSPAPSPPPQPVASAPAATASAIPVLSLPHAPPAAKPTGPTRTADCDPPFTIDAVGHKHYKPACFK